jgi:sec-independent protein translocase protein TatB
MFDITSSKLLLLGIVALIVIGPKDLPVLLRTIGKYVGIIKRQAADFRAQFDEAIRESELDQLKKDVESMGQEAEASMREAERSVTTELDAAKADVEAATDTALLDKPADAQAQDAADVHAHDAADAHAHDMPDVHVHDADGMPIARSEDENALNGAQPHREEAAAAGAPVDGSPRVEHKTGA